MKKYNKPEIVTLALDTVDVIETSGAQALSEQLKNETGWSSVAQAQVINEQIDSMRTTWSW